MKNKLNFSAAFFAFLVLPCAFAFSENKKSENALKIPPVEESFVIKNQDGSDFTEENLDGNKIIKFSMCFGLLDESSPEFVRAFSAYENLKNYCRASGIENLGEEERGEAVLSAMYSKVLSQYSLKQTKVDVALNSGVYNCVSSALLYLALASDFGLDARVQQTFRHAFVTLYLSDGRKIDVETTNPYGFNPGTKKSVQQDSKKYAVVPRNYYSSRREISKRRAVTLVAKNLCADLNEKDDYAAAFPLAAAAYSFVAAEKDGARNDFDALAGNFVAYADKNHLQEAALDFLDEVFSRYGKSEYLLKRYNDAAYNSAAFNCNQNNFDLAEANLEKRREKLPRKNAEEIEKIIFESRTFYDSQNLAADDGIKYVQNARKSRFALSDQSFARNLEKAEESFWSMKIVPVFNSGDFLAAALLCGDGLLSLPESSYLKNTRNASLQNYAAEIHNKIVPLVNSKKYGEASEILNRAMKTEPEIRDFLNSRLRNDLKIIQSAM